jgi:integrase
MGLRKRNGTWHYQFQWRDRLYSGTTGLADTERNRKAAKAFEASERTTLKADARRFERKLFPDAAAEFVTWLQEVEYRDRKSTAQRYVVSIASALEFWAARTVDSLGAGDIEQYKTYRLTIHKVRGITRRHDLDAISILNRYCRKMKWTSVDWMEDVKKPSGEAVRMHIITDDEESRYFATAAKINPDLYDLGRLSILQGCRHNSELLTLKQTDVDLKNGKMHIRKAKRHDRGRTLDLTEESVTILDRRLSTQDVWVFPSERKRGGHLKKLQAAHDRVCAEAGVEFVMYDFRHTFATRFAETNPDPYALAAILGHSGLRCVMAYVHVQADAMKKGMEKFDAARNRKKLKVVG